MTTTTVRPKAAGLRRRVLELAERITTPLLPGDYLDLVAPLRSGAPLRGRITAVHPETRDCVTVMIKPGSGWQSHIPGQYVRIGIDVDGVRQWRTYSLTSHTDRPDGHIAITVKAITDGTVSNHLVHRATVGTLVQLDQAAGDFVLPAPAPDKLLFVAAGSGITPIMGILRNLADGTGIDTVVVHCAPTPDDMIFAGELRQLAAQGRIRLIEVHTATDGRLDMTRLHELVGDLTARHTWACGPAGLLDALHEHWTEHGVADQLHTERFRAEILTTGDGGTVTFTRSGTTTEAAGDQTLLDTGEAAGVLMPSGCRMGVCFGCVVPLRRGTVRDVRTGDVTTAAEGDGVAIQTCISAAAGACALDI
ncbi:ferredoxin reductase [Mycolicibacterium phocaicum]|uniref:Stearoyl-CoA 9-desaturase n=1 Tax=Mycolicibacterium phocaicum TaxID=319706 RepID=A0AA94R4N7_9MYCO|nr:ferredoxin reductase [Mycolicibacterium phocaicum]TLH59487.1 stearoyl-CoA 9-desaturase [Mycolicibacterium phocaicum]UCZ60610.1 ferredoxin reductase [Mycolicibacterium phocaicum]